MNVYALLTGRGQNTLQNKNILDILHCRQLKTEIVKATNAAEK